MDSNCTGRASSLTRVSRKRSRVNCDTEVKVGVKRKSDLTLGKYPVTFLLGKFTGHNSLKLSRPNIELFIFHGFNKPLIQLIPDFDLNLKF